MTIPSLRHTVSSAAQMSLRVVYGLRFCIHLSHPDLRTENTNGISTQDFVRTFRSSSLHYQQCSLIRLQVLLKLSLSSSGSIGPDLLRDELH